MKFSIWTQVAAIMTGFVMSGWAQTSQESSPQVDANQVKVNQIDTVYFPKYDTLVRVDTVYQTQKVIEKDTVIVRETVEVEKKSGDAGVGSIADWRNSHGFGLGAGLLSGSGLQYRRWFNKNGFQLTAVPVFDISETKEEYFFNLGIVGLRSIWASDEYEAGIFGPMTSNFHLYYGASVYIDKNKYRDHGDVDWEEEYGEKMYTGGAGLGVEFNTAHLRYSIGAGYAVMKEEQWGHTYRSNENSIKGIPDAYINLQWYFK